MNVIRAGCVLLSLILHALTAVLLIASVHLPQPVPDILTVDITRLAAPETVPELPPPPAMPQAPAQQEAAPTPPVPAKAPTAPPPQPLPPQPLPPQPVPQQPIPAASAPKTPPQPAMEEPLTPELPDDAPAEESPQPEPEPEFDAEGRKVIRIGSVDGLAHRGHEARFGRSLLADFYSYSPNEFAGQFVTPGGRSVSIIDARKTRYGRFLLYDSKTGKLRRLKKFNKYIYTIGPSLNKDEPIMGSVTFLAKNDRIDRFIYMPDGEKKAFFPGKTHFVEQKASVPSCGVRLKSTLTLPGDENYPAVVLVHGSGCLPLEATQGASRALATRGVATIAFVPRGCTSCDIPEEGGLPEDAYRSLRLVRRQKGVIHDSVGYVGVDGGTSAAFEAATRPGAAFLAMVFTAPKAPDNLPTAEAIANLKTPSIWIFPRFGDGYTDIWNNVLKAKKISQTITLRKTTRDDRIPLGTPGMPGTWVLRFGATDAAIVADWIGELLSP